MISFIKELAFHDDKFKFRFTKPDEHPREVYFVLVNDIHHCPVMFIMEAKKDMWLIQDVDSLPTWIKALERQLSLAIIEHESKGSNKNVVTSPKNGTV
jgi:hypothetical protein